MAYEGTFNKNRLEQLSSYKATLDSQNYPVAVIKYDEERQSNALIGFGRDEDAG